MDISQVWLVSASTSVLPFQIQDANNSVILDPIDEPKVEEEKINEEVKSTKDGKKDKKGKDKKEDKSKQVQGGQKDKENSSIINVGTDTRLNYRWLDIRTTTSQSIMRIKTKICQF